MRPQRIRKTGRPPMLLPGTATELFQYLRLRPWAYQDEMAQFLDEELGISVTQQAISRFLKKHRWTKKKAQRESNQRCQELRNFWRNEMARLSAEQCVFVDETGFNERTGWRRFAWAPIGEAARYRADIRTSRNWSVLPAYTMEGYLPCTLIRQQAVDGDAFFHWIVDQVLPLCNRFPGPRSVIIMDNAAIHTNQRVEEAISAAGCLTRYLPPYSPDLNPIELTFSILKGWVRRNMLTAWPPLQREGKEFGHFIRYAIETSGCDRFPEQHFRRCFAGRIGDNIDWAMLERGVFDDEKA